MTMGHRTLICHRVSDMPVGGELKGSFRKKCDTCGADIWASKASLIYTGGQSLICMSCFSKRDTDELEICPPSEGQLREMEDLTQP